MHALARWRRTGWTIWRQGGPSVVWCTSPGREAHVLAGPRAFGVVRLNQMRVQKKHGVMVNWINEKLNVCANMWQRFSEPWHGDLFF